MGRTKKVILNGLRTDVIKLAAEGLKAKAIANKLNEKVTDKKDKISWNAVNTFLKKDAKAKAEVLSQDQKLREQSVKYTISAQKELFKKFQTMSKKFEYLSSRGDASISFERKIELLPRYSRELAYLIQTQEKILGNIKSEGDTTIINFNNMYVNFREIVFSSAREVLSPSDQKKLFEKVKYKIEEDQEDEMRQ